MQKNHGLLRTDPRSVLCVKRDLNLWIQVPVLYEGTRYCAERFSPKNRNIQKLKCVPLNPVQVHLLYETLSLVLPLHERHWTQCRAARATPRSPKKKSLHGGRDSGKGCGSA